MDTSTNVTIPPKQVPSSLNSQSTQRFTQQRYEVGNHKQGTSPFASDQLSSYETDSNSKEQSTDALSTSNSSSPHTITGNPADFDKSAASAMKMGASLAEKYSTPLNFPIPHPSRKLSPSSDSSGSGGKQHGGDAVLSSSSTTTLQFSAQSSSIDTFSASKTSLSALSTSAPGSSSSQLVISSTSSSAAASSSFSLGMTSSFHNQPQKRSINAQDIGLQLRQLKPPRLHNHLKALHQQSYDTAALTLPTLSTSGNGNTPTNGHDSPSLSTSVLVDDGTSPIPIKRQRTNGSEYSAMASSTLTGSSQFASRSLFSPLPTTSSGSTPSATTLSGGTHQLPQSLSTSNLPSLFNSHSLGSLGSVQHSEGVASGASGAKPSSQTPSPPLPHPSEGGKDTKWQELLAGHHSQGTGDDTLGLAPSALAPHSSMQSMNDLSAKSSSASAALAFMSSRASGHLSGGFSALRLDVAAPSNPGTSLGSSHEGKLTNAEKSTTGAGATSASGTPPLYYSFPLPYSNHRRYAGGNNGGSDRSFMDYPPPHLYPYYSGRPMHSGYGYFLPYPYFGHGHHFVPMHPYSMGHPPGHRGYRPHPPHPHAHPHPHPYPYYPQHPPGHPPSHPRSVPPSESSEKRRPHDLAGPTRAAHLHPSAAPLHRGSKGDAYHHHNVPSSMDSSGSLNTLQLAAPSASSSSTHPHSHSHSHSHSRRHNRGSGPRKRAQRARANFNISNSPKTARKYCYSCGSKSSAYWREGWRSDDGTPSVLCNACALRYKKIELACSSCLYVPYKSDEHYGLRCPKCDGALANQEGRPIPPQALVFPRTPTPNDASPASTPSASPQNGPTRSTRSNPQPSLLPQLHLQENSSNSFPSNGSILSGNATSLSLNSSRPSTSAATLPQIVRFLNSNESNQGGESGGVTVTSVLNVNLNPTPTPQHTLTAKYMGDSKIPSVQPTNYADAATATAAAARSPVPST